MEEKTIPVWDSFVRVFHWSLVICIGTAWLSSNDAATLHTVVGYIAGGLVIGRVIWGFVGSKYARFSQFVRSPRIVIRYMKSIVSRREVRYLGHNPAGGAMIIALILAVFATCISGWMLTTDAFWGVLWVQEVHGFAARGILLMVLFHVIGVLVASVRHRENLALAMFSGHKRRPGPVDVV
ncbi:cytochrome b/b6 domain-containing protein [Rhodoferax sp.]|uniref:cytochrome b/b6 domain-containing protein n=1 Tax=Rhodoferax sp. TaxID=50421 RepID=UPI00283CEF09|nr:cytochrome b/b6 domain-containing protein [Rhodoferax sp.]MDR3371904.1 cytochrome b/b6 domain-containing protein [Rhodoferax sp.]